LKNYRIETRARFARDNKPIAKEYIFFTSIVVDSIFREGRAVARSIRSRADVLLHFRDYLSALRPEIFRPASNSFISIPDECNGSDSRLPARNLLEQTSHRNRIYTLTQANTHEMLYITVSYLFGIGCASCWTVKAEGENTGLPTLFRAHRMCFAYCNRSGVLFY
jgi:hypothetical protein